MDDFSMIPNDMREFPEITFYGAFYMYISASVEGKNEIFNNKNIEYARMCQDN